MLVATQFLTRLPTPALVAFESTWLSQSLRYFPLVGVLVGVCNVAVWWVCSRWLPGSVSVGLMLAASMMLTGALHEDGFADTCDGLGGGTTPDRVLSIMKDSRIGAYGAIGIVVLLGIKWATLVSMPPAVFPVAVIAAHMFSRWCAIGLIWRLPYVRIEGDGKARPFAGQFSAREWLLSAVAGLLGLAPVVYAGLASLDLIEARALGVAVAAAAITALIAARYFRRRLGGYTGDCLGAVQQLTELAFLVGGLAAINPSRRLV
jgi:adenosylcobinamide-GDP ribazoletransferase